MMTGQRATTLAVLLGVLYFACVLAIVPMAGPAITPWLLACLSILFVWCYLRFARGRATMAVGIVVLVTLVLPLVALIVIGWPLYPTWSSLGASLWAAFQDRGIFRIVEFVAPAGIAAIGAVLLVRFAGFVRSPARHR